MDCFDLILEKYPNALLLLLGESQEEVNINNKKYNISKYITNKQILDLGVQENPEPYYQLADITLFPSRREGFGNVIIESMAVGTPVIASRIKGITDTIIDNDFDGILIDDAENFILYSIKIEELLNDNTKYNKIKKNSVAKIQDKYTPHLILQQYMSLYKRCIAK